MALRRILLVELEPLVPQANSYATWDPSDVFPSGQLTFTLSNRMVTKNVTHASTWATTRSTQSMSGAGQWYWETVPTFTGTANFTAGICAGSTDYPFTGTQPGTNANPNLIAGPNKAGTCMFNGGPISPAFGAIASGTVIRHWVDYDRGTYKIAVGAGTWQQLNVDADTVRSCRFAFCGLLRPTSSTANMTARMKPADITMGTPDGVNAGIYNVPDPVGTKQYYASEGLYLDLGKATDVYFEPRFAQGEDVEVEREGSCWVWGNSTTSKRGQLTLLNNDGALDGWRDYIWRDTPCVLRSGYEGDAYDDFTVWSTNIVESIEFTAERRIYLSLTDPMSLWDRAIQPNVYSDTSANPQIIGKTPPLVLGSPLYCEPVQLSTNPTVRDYQVDDGLAVPGYTSTLEEITQAYDTGDLFKGPNDAYTANSPITLLNGGSFTTWAADSGGVQMPSGWARITGFGTTDNLFSNSISRMRCQSNGQQLTAIYHLTGVLLAGYRYTIEFTVAAVTKAGNLTFRSDGPNTTYVDAIASITTTGVKTVTIDVLEDTNLQIVLGWLGSAIDVIIDNLTCTSVQIIDWTYWTADATRKGLTLANKPVGKITVNPVGRKTTGLQQLNVPSRILTYISARLVTLYPDTTFPTIDTTNLASGGESHVATYIKEPKTAISLARELLDSVLSWMLPNREGTLIFGTIQEPSQTPVLTLDNQVIAGEVVISPDEAKNLTITIAGQKNHTVLDEVATSVDEATSAKMQTEFLCVRKGAPALTADPVSSAYTAAVGAPPLETLLQDEDEIQNQANQVATLWRPARRFYLVTAILPATTADLLEPGQTIKLLWPRYGLSAGKNLVIIGIRLRFFSRRVDFKLWG